VNVASLSKRARGETAKVGLTDMESSWAQRCTCNRFIQRHVTPGLRSKAAILSTRLPRRC